MPLPKVPRTLRGAIQLADHLLAENGGTLVNAFGTNVSPGLVDIAEKVVGVPVKFYVVPYAQSISICLRTSDGFQIIIPKTFNRCHFRFALCKELCHVISDDHSIRVSDPTAALQTARDSAHSVRENSANLFLATELDSEHFCFVMALELLIPVLARKEILRRLDRGDNSYDIAYPLAIPQKLVEFFHKSKYYVISQLLRT
jgi:hypothetical protein